MKNKSLYKNLKDKLPDWLMPLLIAPILYFLLNPTVKILETLLEDWAFSISRNLILQLWVSLFFVLLSAIAYIISLKIRLNKKKDYRHFVFWYKNKPYCPYCSNKIKEIEKRAQCVKCGATFSEAVLNKT